MVGYQQGAEEFTPIRLVARGKERLADVVFHQTGFRLQFAAWISWDPNSDVSFCMS